MSWLRSKKSIYFLVGLVAVLSVTLGLFTDSTFLIISATHIQMDASPLNTLVQADVKERIQNKLRSFRGQNILAVPIDRIQQHILSDVWVESVILERKLPNTLQVKVKLKTVVFVYLDKRGRFLPISDQGQLLNPVASAVVPDVPLLRNVEMIKNPKLLKSVLALFRQISVDGVFSQKKIAEVDWSVSEGLIVEMTNGDGGRIVLGKDNVRAKAARITTVLKYLESQNQKWRVIDASFRKKVLVRLRKHS